MMKRVIPLSILAIGLLVAYVSLSTPEDSSLYEMNLQAEDDVEFPAEVAKLLENSCYDCHTTASKNDDAKDALDFNKWNDLKTSKKISALDGICEVIESGDMPPKKYLEHYPATALSDDQVKLICDWVEKESESLMQEKKK